MNGERSDSTREQFDSEQGRPAESGYPEEQPGGAVPDDTPGGSPEQSGSEPTTGRDQPEGGSGEGSQSTGHPGNAG